MNRVVTSFHWKFPLGKKYSREFYPLGFYPPREEIRGRWEFERKSRLMREEGEGKLDDGRGSRADRESSRRKKKGDVKETKMDDCDDVTRM